MGFKGEKNCLRVCGKKGIEDNCILSGIIKTLKKRKTLKLNLVLFNSMLFWQLEFPLHHCRPINVQPKPLDSTFKIHQEMIKLSILFYAVLFIASPTTFVSAQKNLVLQSANVVYKIKNAGVNTNGSFKKVAAEVIFDANNLEKSKISATVQVNSLDSGIGLRDKHLKGENYFDAEKYPVISLVATKITKTDNGYLGTFNLSIKAITQSIQLPFTVTPNGNVLDFQTTEFSINRLTYGVGKSSITLSNTVNISIKATFSM